MPPSLSEENHRLSATVNALRQLATGGAYTRLALFGSPSSSDRAGHWQQRVLKRLCESGVVTVNSDNPSLYFYQATGPISAGEADAGHLLWPTSYPAVTGISHVRAAGYTLTTRAAAEMLGLTTRAVQVACKTGRLPHHREAHFLFFKEEDVRAYSEKMSRKFVKSTIELDGSTDPTERADPAEQAEPAESTEPAELNEPSLQEKVNLIVRLVGAIATNVVHMRERIDTIAAQVEDLHVGLTGKPVT